MPPRRDVPDFVVALAGAVAVVVITLFLTGVPS
jgi:hypothetical protein